MTPSSSLHAETDLTVALKALLALAPSDKSRTRKDVSKFLKELTDFVSGSAEEIAAAYMKEALKQSLTELTVEVGSKIAGLAVKQFTVILLTIFFQQTDKSLSRAQKWSFLSALNSGTANALQALNVVCESKEDFGLRDHLLKSAVTQLNEAYEKSRKDPRIFLYVRLMQALSSEALGAHAFTKSYLSQCLPQIRERYLDSKRTSENYAYRARRTAERGNDVRLIMAKNPAGWTHDKPDTRGDLQVGFESEERAIDRFNATHEIQYIEDPAMLDLEAKHYKHWSDRDRRQMDFYGVLVQLAERS
jgi:hypothetical protein